MRVALGKEKTNKTGTYSIKCWIWMDIHYLVSVSGSKVKVNSVISAIYMCTVRLDGGPRKTRRVHIYK